MDAVSEVFDGATLRRQPLLARLRDHLDTADPAYLLTIKKKSNVWRLFVQIAALPRPVTHADLDGLGTPRSVSQVRSLLVAVGVLPPRDEYAFAVERLAADAVAALPHREDQLALRRFLRWRQQHRRSDAPLTISQAANDRTELRVIVDLIGAFNTAGATVATADQAALDAWARGHQIAFRARRFLTWSARTGITLQLAPPPHRGSGFRLGGDLGSGNEQALHRVLIDAEEIPARLRLAVLLTTVYAVRVHRIAGLHRDALRLEEVIPRIRLGSIDVDLPAAAAPWVNAILAGGMPKRRAGGAGRDDIWIFPGDRHGGHMLPSSLSTQLKQLGVSPVGAHQSSAATLITQMPPAVVARLLGVRNSTAAKWQQLAGTDPAHR
ncbi:hypothetical protein ACLQ2Q_15585 [Microbacterium sp. DT81.1]|uniref:hypothetical protein n=1 Tax=Microbacterium sp. DT81.1 TaxID=3393413 RepID=UPI003CF6A218